ncbi:MAG: hypothetical protein IKG18_14635 [Atopobiaceae bacterium]|nr:hypothetical protein [Atopobiaceae bacterium]
MTARDKICPLRSGAQGSDVRARPLASLCNPIECPLSRGHYDSVNDALFEAISSSRVLDADHIEQLASAHHVCPYELQRDAARWADVIVCDYHYAFAPATSLFGLPDDPDDGDVVFLVDEAHNLVDRMREMYSAELTLASLRELDRLVGRTASFGPLSKTLRTAIAAFPTWERALPASAQTGSHGNRYQPTYRVVSLSTAFTESPAQLSEDIESALAQFVPSTDGNGQPSGQPTGHAIELFLAMRDTNQALRAFLGAL